MPIYAGTKAASIDVEPSEMNTISTEQVGAGRYALHFTPAEWRHLLENPSFLKEAENSVFPRRLMGVPVKIVPDHQTSLAQAA